MQIHRKTLGVIWSQAWHLLAARRQCYSQSRCVAQVVYQQHSLNVGKRDKWHVTDIRKDSISVVSVLWNLLCLITSINHCRHSFSVVSFSQTFIHHLATDHLCLFPLYTLKLSFHSCFVLQKSFKYADQENSSPEPALELWNKRSMDSTGYVLIFIN